MIKALFPITAGATVALLLTVPSAVAALDAAPAGEDAGDRDVTRAEATDMAGRLFDRIDANHDGRIDAADRQARFARMRARFEAERTARLAARFDAMDANHDGTISRAEFMAAHVHGPDAPMGPPPPPSPPPPPPPPPPPLPPPPAMVDGPPAGLALGYDAPGAAVRREPGHRGPQAPGPAAPDWREGGRRGDWRDPAHGDWRDPAHGDWRDPAHGDWRDPAHGPRGDDGALPHGAAMAAPMMAGLILRAADPQHTGSVSRAAFIAAAQGLFDRADANHDGTLTPDERRAARKALREDMRAGRGDRRFGGPDGVPPPPPPPPSPPHD